MSVDVALTPETIAEVDVTGQMADILDLPEHLLATARELADRYDALLFNTPGLCRSAPDLIERIPTVLVTDVTPKQLVEMEDYYGKLGGLQGEMAGRHKE